MLNIVCVQSGNYEGRGAEYVNTLFDMVRRNLAEGFEGRFVCLTDDPHGLHGDIIAERLPGHLKGWWNKLWLFRHGVFRRGDQVLYFDLDTVITGPLDDIASYRGPFAILRDFYRQGGLQSSVMSWTVSAETEGIYDGFRAAKYPDLEGGDQEWIERCVEKPDIWQSLFPGSFASYKEQAREGIPKGARVVCFHGDPKPHDVTRGWVPHIWKVGGGSSLEFVIECNTPVSTIAENIRAAMALKTEWLQVQEPHNGTALVVAGGPSLGGSLPSLHAHKASGAAIFAVNGSLKYLADRGIEADYHVILDARRDNLNFVQNLPATRIYSSQCHPELTQQADCLFHPYFDGIHELTGTTDGLYIGGGTTAGLKAILIAYTLGYRKLHLHGFDSCYQGEKNHAYTQPMNDGERIIEVTIGNDTFRCAPWMVTQAEEFRTLAQTLIAANCELYVHGTGLIPAISSEMSRGVTPADQRAFAILRRLNGKTPVYGAEIGVFAGDLSKRLLASRADLCLLMVDSWATEHRPEYAESGDFHATMTADEQNGYAEFTRAATAFAGERAIILRRDSIDAASSIPDGSLHFVFIDADHSYGGCRADIEAWFPKVRDGGFISGHDYENTEFPQFGVKRAVDEFIAAHKLKLELDQNYTWFARKGSD